MARIPKELRVLEDQIALLDFTKKALAVLAGEQLTEKDLDVDNISRMARKKLGIDNNLYINEKSDRLDKIQEKAFALKQELSRFKADLEVDFTDKIKSLQDPSGRFTRKNASIKEVVKKHLKGKNSDQV